MRIAFIRHSKAVEKEFWEKDNSLRPLSKVGHFRAKRFAGQLVKIYHHDVDYLITSSFVKNVETAEYIKKELKPRFYLVDNLLNPGFDFSNFCKLIKGLPDSANTIFLVGHCPDFINIITQIIKDKRRTPYLKKPSLIEIEFDEFPSGKINFNYSLDDGEEFPFKNHEPYFDEIGEIPL